MAASQKDTSRQRRRLVEQRILIAGIAVLFLGGAVTLWILNALNVIQGSWSNELSIVFTFVSVLIGLFQWLFPVTGSEPVNASSASPALPPIVVQVPPAEVVPVIAEQIKEKVVYRGIMGLPPPTDPRTIEQREAMVREVYARLIEPATSAVVLTGIGGVGKSTLAALVYNYAEAQRQAGRGPFTARAVWLNIDPSTTMADLAGNLCEIFGKPLPDLSVLSLQHQAMTLCNLLNSPDEARLIIFDQFENLLNWQTGHALANRPGVGEWLDALNSQPCRSRILMTTRPRPLGTREYPPTCMHEYIVRGLEPAEGIELLRRRGVEASDTTLRILVERCGGHAFALSMLASLLQHRNLTLSTFFNDQNYAHVWTGNVARNLLDEIFTRQLNDTQRKLLLAFSVYREPVPLDAARALCDFTEDVAPGEIDQALDILLAQHLLQATGDGSYQLHAIVNNYAQDNFVPQDQQASEQALCAAHARAAQYYIGLVATTTGRRAHLSDYDPLTEAAWQFCQARQWRDAYNLIERENLFEGLKAVGGLLVILELYKLLLPLKKWQAQLAEGVNVYNHLGSIYRSLGRREISLQYLEQANALGKGNGETREHAWTLNHLGRLYTSMGQKERARSYYEEALEQARVNNDRVLEGVVLNNLGWIYCDRGEKGQERNSHEEALAICREIGDRQGEAVTLNNLGRLEEDLGHGEQARQHYKDALAIFQELGNQGGKGWTLNNLGRSYLLAGDKEHARLYLHQALEIRHEVDRKGEGRTLNNIGALYTRDGDYQHAWECYLKVLEITEELADPEGRGKTLRHIGQLFLVQKRYPEALAFLLCAQTLLNEVQSLDREYNQADINRLRQEVSDDEFISLLADVEPRAQALVEQRLKEHAT